MKWECKKCGRCCHKDNIPDLELVTTVGDDGYCIHFDKDTKLCNEHENRPSGCRIYPRFLNVFLPQKELNLLLVAQDLDIFHYGGFPYRVDRRLCVREKHESERAQRIIKKNTLENMA
jgi:Fe-S-cluster containining protein